MPDMIPISELKYVERAFFAAELCYHKPELYRFVEKNFSEEKPLDADTLERIEQLQQQCADNLAHNVLLKKDLQTLRAHFHKNDLKFDDGFWLSKLPVIHKRIEKALGLKFQAREIKFVERFPDEHQSYEAKGASAITVFEGMPNAGIYFINKRLDKVSTGVHIIHEQIHACLSQNKDKDQAFIEWFEEGIAIFFSLQIYYEITKDLEGMQRYRTRSYIFSKVKPEWDFTKRYFEYMKIIAALFLEGGKERLLKVLKWYLHKERQRVNEELRLVNRGEIRIKYVPRGEFEQFIATFPLVIEPELITPLEFMIIDTLKHPRTLEELASEINAPVDVTKQSLNSLFAKGICLMTKENKIDVNWRKKDLFDEGLLKPILPLR